MLDAKNQPFGYESRSMRLKNIIPREGYKTIIRRQCPFVEAPSHGLIHYDYDPRQEEQKFLLWR